MLNWVFTFKVRLSCITLDYGEVLWSCAWIQGQFACVHAMSWQIYLLMVPSKQDQCEESRKKFLKWIDVHFPPDEKSFFPKRTSVESLKFCIKFDFFECFSFQAFFFILSLCADMRHYATPSTLKTATACLLRPWMLSWDSSCGCKGLLEPDT